MDNLCHTLTGAALGEAGLKRTVRWGSPTLMIAANLPDADALVFLTGVPSVAFRRGWTHGVAAQILLPPLLTAAVVMLDRLVPARRGDLRVRPATVLALSYAGVLSHVFLDYLNTYGIRLLMPFSGRWFYGDAVFIIDPWLWLTLGAGLWFSRRRRTPRAAGVALAVATCYIGAMLVSAWAARTIVEKRLHQGGATPQALMVGPVPIDPFTRAVIADLGDHYRTGTFSWWGIRLWLDDRIVRKNDRLPAVIAARGDPDVQRVLVWARFAQYEVTAQGAFTRVTLRDMRFGSRVGRVVVLVPE